VGLERAAGLGRLCSPPEVAVGRGGAAARFLWKSSERAVTVLEKPKNHGQRDAEQQRHSASVRVAAEKRVRQMSRPNDRFRRPFPGSISESHRIASHPSRRIVSHHIHLIPVCAPDIGSHPDPGHRRPIPALVHPHTTALELSQLSRQHLARLFVPRPPRLHRVHRARPHRFTTTLQSHWIRISGLDTTWLPLRALLMTA
jgi:hypothetical protein